MKRWVGAILVLALAAIVVSAPPVKADVTAIYINITSYEKNPAQGSTFDVSFTVHVPSDITIPTSSAYKPCFLYYSTFFFVGKDIYYPAEGYWWGDYAGSVFYTSGTTEYTVKVKMATGEKVDQTHAPVGQKFYLGIYWKIPLESDWSNPQGKDIGQLSKGDNVTFKIYGDNNTYTMSIVDEPDVYTDYTKYTIFEGQSDLYVRTDSKNRPYLYVRTLKSDLTVTAAPGFEIPLWLVIAGVVVLLGAIVAVALSRRGKGEELPPVPEMTLPPPPEAPPAPPEAPPAPPEAPPSE